MPIDTLCNVCLHDPCQTHSMLDKVIDLLQCNGMFVTDTSSNRLYDIIDDIAHHPQSIDQPED